jgi:hypothetical protein
MGKLAVSFVKINANRGYGADVHRVIGSTGRSDLILKNVRTSALVTISPGLTYKDAECMEHLTKYRQGIGAAKHG